MVAPAFLSEQVTLGFNFVYDGAGNGNGLEAILLFVCLLGDFLSILN